MSNKNRAEVTRPSLSSSCKPVHKRKQRSKKGTRRFVNVTVNKIRGSVTVAKVVGPIRVRGIEKPLVVSHVVQPVIIDKVQTPVTVQEVVEPISVGTVETPVRVQGIATPTEVSKIDSPVVVQNVQEPVTIRPLSQNADKVTIYGSNTEIPVETDSEGRIIISGQLQVSPVVYSELSFFDLHSSDELQSLPPQDRSIQTTLSYAVVNQSESPATIFLEISPNNIDFSLDSELIAREFSTEVVTPLRYLRYIRLSYKSAIPGQHASFDVYFQAQSG